ncbi:MAG: hypothetical protein Udaeo2_09260 [Candidatus Udaeobacter sp.]|nr:MAG: hypothetical protein Udaeo2_09260 [Candidatus Udaeobacter sp.]
MKLSILRKAILRWIGNPADILQAASDVTRTRTTRLSAIYLHNAALARLTHACGSSAEELNFDQKSRRTERQPQGDASC